MSIIIATIAQGLIINNDLNDYNNNNNNSNNSDNKNNNIPMILNTITIVLFSSAIIIIMNKFGRELSISRGYQNPRPC